MSRYPFLSTTVGARQAKGFSLKIVVTDESIVLPGFGFSNYAYEPAVVISSEYPLGSSSKHGFFFSDTLGLYIFHVLQIFALSRSFPVFFYCNGNDNIVGSGNLIPKNRDATDLTDISVSESILVDVSKGDKFRFLLTADDNVIHRVESVIGNGNFAFPWHPAVTAARPSASRLPCRQFGESRPVLPQFSKYPILISPPMIRR